MLCIRTNLLYEKQDVLCISTNAIVTGMTAMCKNKSGLYKMHKLVIPRAIRRFLHFLAIGSMSFLSFSCASDSVSPIFTSKSR